MRLPRALVGLLVLPVAMSVLPPALPAAAAVPDYDVAGGRFFTQAAGGGERGFAVVDDAGAAFYAEFVRLGGVSGVGYPISRRFLWNGYLTQAMQRVVFQWRPETRSVAFVNVFDLMTETGRDDWLRTVRAVPRPLPPSFDAGKAPDQVVQDRLALLDENPAIRERYFAVAGDPITMNGLPTSRVLDMGTNFTLRAQRVVLQQWKVEVPWAARGQVTVALGGSIAAEAGLLSAAALAPEPRPAGAPVDGHDLLAPIGKERPLLEGFLPEGLTEVRGVHATRTGILLRRDVFDALRAMDTTAAEQGVRLVVVSGYRSYQEQAALFRYYSERMGAERAGRISARPGHSEHQMGVAIDFTSPETHYSLEADFGTTTEGRWLRDHAHRFGFVLSYPEGQEEVTGYAYEPWHYRFIGAGPAAALRASGLTLKEYLHRNNPG